jgi:hypothetical protein
VPGTTFCYIRLPEHRLLRKNVLIKNYILVYVDTVNLLFANRMAFLVYKVRHLN